MNRFKKKARTVATTPLCVACAVGAQAVSVDQPGENTVESIVVPTRRAARSSAPKKFH